MRERVDTHTVNHEIVVGLALTGCCDLDLVLCLKNSGVGTARASTIRKKNRLPVSATRAIAGDARRSTHQFIWVGAKCRQPLNLLTVDGCADARVCRLQQRDKIAVHLNRLSSRAWLKFYIHTSRGFGCQSQIRNVTRSESRGCNLECVLSRRQFVEVIRACLI